MTKAELVAYIAEESGISKKAALVALDTVISSIHESLASDDRIRIADLGSFTVVTRKARKGVNPRTGDPINIPATKAAKFTAAKALKDVIG